LGSHGRGLDNHPEVGGHEGDRARTLGKKKNGGAVSGRGK